MKNKLLELSYYAFQEANRWKHIAKSIDDKNNLCREYGVILSYASELYLKCILMFNGIKCTGHNLYDLYNVIDRASILTSDKDKNIVTLETIANTLYMRSSSAEIGRVEEKMDIEKDNDENIKISFSARYMMEALKSFTGTHVELSFVGEVKPIIIKDKDEDELTQLVLPIRTY